jgi:lipopolysaccharide heptosyltransferase II
MKIEKLKIQKIDLSKVEKILVIKLRAIGDVLLSTPVIKNLKNNFPNASIDFLTEPQSTDILKGNSYLNDVIIFGRKEKGYLRFLNSLKKRKYDLVIDLFCNPRSAQMAFSTRATYRVGYSFRLRKYAYNVLLKSRSNEVHNVDFNLDALRALGLNVNQRIPVLQIGSTETEFAREFFKKEFLEGDKIVGLNAGGGWEAKLWGLPKFAELADRLIENYNYRVLIFWGPGQEQIHETLKKMMRYKPVIAPATSLKEMAALQKKCEFIVSNDSGPMHIAASVGVPTMGIFGPTRTDLQGPVGEDCVTVIKEGLVCLGCNLTVCKIGNMCMTDLSVDDVLNKIIKWRKIYGK